MKLFHRTPYPDAILANGFKDATGNYMMNVEVTGVWFSNVPLDINEGAKGKGLLVVTIPDELIADYEVVEEEKPYREWCIPASIANNYLVRMATEEEDEREF